MELAGFCPEYFMATIPPNRSGSPGNRSRKLPISCEAA